jgi:ATP-binding cassette subfamily B protein
LEDLQDSCTVLVIAQRYSSIALADRVVVLENGRVVGAGAPADLRSSSEVFRRVLNLDGGPAECGGHDV